VHRATYHEWYISPQRIDGLDFHLRELRVHKDVMSGGGSRIEHEILQPRIQDFGDTVIVTYTLLIRGVSGGSVIHKSHNETRVFHDFGTANAPQWKLVHCHKSPIATADSLDVLRG
jgi:ketosteroid isomerase-like protein